MQPPLPIRFVLVVVSLGLAVAADARQLRVSPGPLTRAHADLEGVANCGKCHESGQQLSAERCLGCHKPIALRIARHAGVHRNVTGNCQACHAEHRGVDADLRRIDPATFDHAAETGYPLEHEHAKLAGKCASCHKVRSFLAARPLCSTCHDDAHKGNLGQECARCHATDLPFKQTRRQFDHQRARFLLTGAHRTVACEKCHAAGVFRGLHYDVCSACHKPPHRNALGPACTTCHVTDRWQTREIVHARTGFELVGAHARLACEKCHTAGITKPIRAERCASCHSDVHRASVKEDCRKCHNENSFRGATLDHAVLARFPLDGKHQGLACRKCHTGISAPDVPLAQKAVSFAGASAECVSCHKDQHKGEFGQACEACHRPTTFQAKGFTHPRTPEFFGGRHAGVACVRCHVRVADAAPAKAGLRIALARGASPSTACTTCHADVHLGQVGTACERCHAVDGERFAPVLFSHAKGEFPLSGRHQALECVKCHPRETRAYPAGTGTAARLSQLSTECRTCHQDPHLGQVTERCPTCHSTSSFRLLTYRHAGMEDFFNGLHGRLPCASCHKKETGEFPAGRGTAVRLKVGRTCAACHPQY